MTITRKLLGSAALAGKVANKLYVRTPAKRQVDQRRSSFYDKVWTDAAAAVGGSVRHLQPQLLEIACGDVVLRARNNVTSLDDPVTVAIAEDKPLVYRLLAEHGIPVPRHEVCRADDLAAAWRFVKAAAGPCVVKPARGSAGGTGITTGVHDQARLAVALVKAGVFCDEALIEEHVAGGVYRLLYFDGELLDAVLRRPPTVRGDGISTVRQLIESENRARTEAGIEAGQSLVQIDWELKETLRGQGLGLRAVPGSDQIVVLKNVVNDNRRDDNEDAMGTLCPALVADGARTAAAIAARLVGVDVITADPGVPLAESGGKVIEVNTTPGYYYHYMRKGPGVPVAVMVLERLAGSR